MYFRWNLPREHSWALIQLVMRHFTDFCRLTIATHVSAHIKCEMSNEYMRWVFWCWKFKSQCNWAIKTASDEFSYEISSLRDSQNLKWHGLLQRFISIFCFFANCIICKLLKVTIAIWTFFFLAETHSGILLK